MKDRGNHEYNSFRDRPKRLFLVTALTETGAEIQLLVSAVTRNQAETNEWLTAVTVTETSC